jgi:hypothetical protein
MGLTNKTSLKVGNLKEMIECKVISRVKDLKNLCMLKIDTVKNLKNN